MNFPDLDVAKFEWNEEKNRLNEIKHGIDFDEASEIFYSFLIVRRSDRKDEVRWNAIGLSDKKLIAVTFTRRGENIRIISARRARKNEERDYRHAEMGRPPEGQD